MDRFLVSYKSSTSENKTESDRERSDKSGNESYESETVSNDSSSQEARAENARSKKRKKKYKQKFTNRWGDRFGDWLSKAPNSDSSYCKVCAKTIKGSKTHLERHEKAAYHIKRMKSVENTMVISEEIKKMGENEVLIKEGELKLAMFVVEHDLSLNLMTHLPKLLTSVCPDSKIAQSLMSSRTKTTDTIKNVIGPYAAKEINNDLGDEFYSIIIDETTDITTKKCLCVLIRYFSNKKMKVCDRFLALIEMEGSKANDIFNALINCLQKNNLSLQKILGFSADNCATMMGELNGVQALLKNIVPHLVVMGCTAHSLNLCSSYACLKIPRRVEDLVRDIFSHFQHSSNRKKIFEEFQEFCQIKPHKLLRPSETRWLSLQQVSDRVLEQYDALKLYFTRSALEDNLHKSQTILTLLNNNIYKLYLSFLSYILKLVNKVNVEFQSERPRIHQLLPRVTEIYKLILKNYMKPNYINNTLIHMINPGNPTYFLKIEDIYFGATVEIFLTNNSDQISETDVNDFRRNCLSFYVELCTQFRKRFPFQDELYQQLTWLDPVNIFSDKKVRSIALLVRRFPNVLENNFLEDVNTEWRRLNELAMKDFKDLESLLEYLTKQRNAVGESVFTHLIKFLKAVLCLPHGSAAAERVFSSLNLIKRKNRNCLLVDTCHNLLLSKELLKDSCCYEWQPPNDLVRSYIKK